MAQGTAFVADDDASVRRLAVRLLEEAGWSARGFASGAQLLAASRRQPPDLVLCDVELGEAVDGLEIFRQLSPRVAVVLMTGSQEKRAEARSLGCPAVLLKPFTRVEFDCALALFGKRT